VANAAKPITAVAVISTDAVAANIVAAITHDDVGTDSVDATADNINIAVAAISIDTVAADIVAAITYNDVGANSVDTTANDVITALSVNPHI